MQRITAPDFQRHIQALTQDIGVRLAGSAGERRAADYIAEQLRSAGAQVHVEQFDVRERAVEEEHLEVRVNGEWRRFPCSLLGNAVGTDGRTREAALVFFASQTDYQRKDLSVLSGKAVVHLGSHIQTADYYRRLAEAKPAFVMFVDVRYPGSVVTADGMFPAYTHAYGPLPIVSVSFMDAWHWREKGATAARLRVAGGMRPSTSSNVIAELPGTDADSGMLIVGAHHDTQADSVGADDNAVGVAAVLELARTLSDAPRKRSIRLISFGAEEQLSVGSATYVRRHRRELGRKGRFMLNFDSFGSLLGWTELSCCGSKEMGEYLNRFFVARDEYVSVKNEAVPYADHFPFAASGVPSAWLGRSNCTSGRFFHHRPDDTIARIGVSLAVKLLNISLECLASLALEDPLPMPTRMPEDLQREIRETWEDLFGGWAGFEP
jgi:Iap family predicted aminopeptidase